MVVLRWFWNVSPSSEISFCPSACLRHEGQRPLNTAGDWQLNTVEHLEISQLMWPEHFWGSYLKAAGTSLMKNMWWQFSFRPRGPRRPPSALTQRSQHEVTSLPHRCPRLAAGKHPSLSRATSLKTLSVFINFAVRWAKNPSWEKSPFIINDQRGGKQERSCRQTNLGCSKCRSTARTVANFSVFWCMINC